MSALGRLSRVLYLASRTSGDLNALNRRGAGGLAKRVVKRQIHRREIGLLRRGRLW